MMDSENKVRGNPIPTIKGDGNDGTRLILRNCGMNEEQVENTIKKIKKIKDKK